MKHKILQESDFLRKILDDLTKPVESHIAFERIGFLICISDNNGLIVPVEYLPINDDEYLKAPRGYGAYFGKTVLDRIYSYLYKDEVIIYDIHIHEVGGVPIPSAADLISENQFVSSFVRIRPAPHGSIILSKDSALIRFWDTELSVMSEQKIPCDYLSKYFEEKERYSRQSFLSDNLQDILRSKRVAVIGLGGGGSLICQSLAHLGFTNLVICDFDKVTISNMNRLVGATEEDVITVRSKTEIASRLIKSVNCKASLRVIESQWQVGAQEGHFDDVDLVCGCLDSFEQRRQLENFCRKKRIDYLDIGMDVSLKGGFYHAFGQVILSIPGDFCMHCYGFFDHGTLAKEACLYSSSNTYQVIFVNSALVAEAMSLLMNHFTGWKKVNSRSSYLEYYCNDSLWRKRELSNSVICTHY